MDFKTSYFKLAEVLKNLSDNIAQNKSVFSIITELMAEQDINAQDWIDFSFTYGEQGVCYAFEREQDGIHLIENTVDRGLALAETVDGHISYDAEVLMKLGDGTKTTLSSLFSKYSAYIGSLNIQYEAAREALNGDYSISNLTAYAQSAGALKAPSLMNTVHNIASSLGSNSGNFVTQLLSWFKNTYSNVKGTTHEEDANIDWTETDYSSRSILGGVIIEVIGGAVQLLGVVLAFAAKIVGVLLTVVGKAISCITNLITSNVQDYAEYNDAGGINAYNLRLNYGTLESIEVAANKFGTAYKSQIISCLTDSKLCVISGGLWSAYLWIDGNGGQVKYEIYPTAIGLTDSGLQYYANMVKSGYKWNNRILSQVYWVFDNAKEELQWFCEQSQFFVPPSEATSDQLRNGLVFNLLACSTLALRVGYTRTSSTDPLDPTTVDDIHYGIIYQACHEGIMDYSFWDLLKKCCEIINTTNDDYFLNWTLSGFIFTPFQACVFSNDVYQPSIIPFLLAKGNFSVMVPKYSENWLAHTIWAMVGIAAATALVCVSKFMISKAVNQFVTRNELRTESLQYEYEDNPTDENFKAYWKSYKKTKRLYKFTGQAGLGYYADDSGEEDDSSLIAGAAESVSDTSTIISLISNGSI